MDNLVTVQHLAINDHKLKRGRKKFTTQKYLQCITGQQQYATLQGIAAASHDSKQKTTG
jgi:hypothetical protein